MSQERTLLDTQCHQHNRSQKNKSKVKIKAMPLRQHNNGQFQHICEISGISGKLGALEV